MDRSLSWASALLQRRSILNRRCSSISSLFSLIWWSLSLRCWGTWSGNMTMPPQWRL